MLMYTIVENAPHSDCVSTILAKLKQMRGIFEAARDLGGGHAAAGLVCLFSLISAMSSPKSTIVNSPETLHVIPGHCRWPRHTRTLCIMAHRAERDLVASSRHRPSAFRHRSGCPCLICPSSCSSHVDTDSIPLASSDEYDWLDDGVSDSFKSLFRSHYRDAQQLTSLSTISVPDSRLSPPCVPAASTSYPGYLQHSSVRSVKSSRMKEKALTQLTCLPELHTGVLRANAQHVPSVASPVVDTAWPFDSGSLSGIRLAHSRQLSSSFPAGTALGSSTQDHHAKVHVADCSGSDWHRHA
jgi:hypothetical protein